MLHNDHNVYILGAGFSWDAGIPVVSNFMNRMRDAHPWLTAAGRRDEAAAVEKVLQFRLDAASAAHRVRVDVENIEQLFSLASSLNVGRRELDERDVRLAISATIDFAEQNAAIPEVELAFEQGTAIPHNWPASPQRSPGGNSGRSWRLLGACDFYLGVMLGVFSATSSARQNSLITFNYDNVVERALERLGHPFTYGFKGKSVGYEPNAPGTHGAAAAQHVRLLKLHGSLNWAVKGGRGGKLRVYKDYAAVRASGLVPTLVPPTWRKTFARQLDDVWLGCVDALSTATRIVVIGFSLPDTDLHFKYMLAAGLQRNISLRRLTFVDPRALLLRERAQAALETSHLDGVLEIQCETTATYLTRSAYRSALGRQLDAGGYYRDAESPSWAREALERVGDPRTGV